MTVDAPADSPRLARPPPWSYSCVFLLCNHNYFLIVNMEIDQHAKAVISTLKINKYSVINVHTHDRAHVHLRIS